MGRLYGDLANSSGVDARAIAAQTTADTALADAIAAQTDATQALADAAAALSAAQAAALAADAAGIRQVTFWVPFVSTPFVAASGLSAAASIGTANIELPAGGSGMSASRVGAICSTAAGAGSSAAYRNSGQGVVLRGGAAGEGGFRLYFRFSTPITNATTRCFFGIQAAPATWTGTPNVDPTSKLDLIGIGFEANNGDANLQIIKNDGSGTGTKTDLGSNFVISNTAIWEATFIAAPNSSSIDYKITNLETGNVATGNLSSDLPTATTALASIAIINNGSTASAVRLKLFYHRLENYS